MKPQTIKVSREVQREVERILAEIPDRHTKQFRDFTPLEDALILAGFPGKSRVALARRLKCHAQTLRRRYAELTKGRGV